MPVAGSLLYQQRRVVDSCSRWQVAGGNCSKRLSVASSWHHYGGQPPRPRHLGVTVAWQLLPAVIRHHESCQCKELLTLSNQRQKHHHRSSPAAEGLAPKQEEQRLEEQKGRSSLRCLTAALALTSSS